MIISEYSIDGSDLGIQSTHYNVEGRTDYVGVFSRFGGIEKTRALQFVKPLFSQDDTSGGNGDMGHAEIRLYEGIYGGREVYKDFASSFDPMSQIVTGP